MARSKLKPPDHEFMEWTTPDMSGRVLVQQGGGCKLCGQIRAAHTTKLKTLKPLPTFVANKKPKK